jgi:restriction system protein
MLDVPPPMPPSFGAMRRVATVPPFDPGPLAIPVTPPDWADFEPSPPRGLGSLFGRGRHEQDVARAEEDYRRAVAAARQAEDTRRDRLRAARAAHDQRIAETRARVDAHNTAVDAFEGAFRAGEDDAVEDYVAQVLSGSVYPEEFPTERRVAYRAEPLELWIEAELPLTDVVPPERGFRYVKTRRAIDPLPRAERETKQLYASVVAQVALRTIREVFVTTPRELVDVVAYNGHVTTRDPATGKQIRPCLVSVSAKRADFDELEFAHLDPRRCLNHLNAIVSNHPYDLEPVPPVIEFDLAKYKFVDEFDAAGELDGRSDLLKMDAFKFEHLIRQLFEARGMTGWAKTTRGSRDDGVDAVVVNPDPVFGGVCVIQAKRYSGVVPAEAVRALWGTMDDKRATTGILVTTSWFGSASRQFAANRQERLRLIEGPELKHLLEVHLGLKARIGLPRQPPTRR